jgi:perosamine synthetase
MWIDPEKAIFAGRGTAALWALLVTRGPAGKAVVPVNVCEGVAGALIYAGWEPVFHDVDPLTGNPELSHLEAVDTTGVTLWVAVHNYGTPLDLPRLMPWARARGLTVIEDTCLATGGEISGQPLGHFGDAAIYSFGYAKIAQIGMGGAATVQEPAWREAVQARLAELPMVQPEHQRMEEAFQAVLRALRQNPWVQKPDVYRAFYREYIPRMLFMPDAALEAAMLAKLAEIPNLVTQRNRLADHYRHRLNHPLIQHRPPTPGAVCWRYTFLVPSQLRDALLDALRGQGIPASAWFPPIHHLFHSDVDPDDFPGAENFGRRVINLWADQTVSPDVIDRTTDIIHAYLDEHA